MSHAFAPVIPAIPQQTKDERLARFVPAALRRTPPVAKAWPAGKAAVLGFATAGLLPFWLLRKRIGQTITYHARQCELAVETLVRHVDAEDLAVLQTSATDVHVSRVRLHVGAIAWCVGVACFAYWLGGQGDPVRQVWPLISVRTVPAGGAGLAGLMLLCFAYLILIAHINAQLLRMQQFVLAFNAVCGDRFGTIDTPSLVWGVRPLHLVLGIVIAWLGPVWLLPMMMAWAAHTAFSWRVGARMRAQLADRLIRATGVDPVMPTGDLCPNPDCRECVPADARFCRRCGGPVNT